MNSYSHTHNKITCCWVTISFLIKALLNRTEHVPRFSIRLSWYRFFLKSHFMFVCICWYLDVWMFICNIKYRNIFTFSNEPFVNLFVKSNGDLISDKNSDPKSKIHSFIILMTIAASTQEFYARYLRAISPQQQIIKSFFIQLYWNIVIVTINEFVRPCEMHTPSFSRCGFCQT